jgi:hypothetical protein
MRRQPTSTPHPVWLTGAGRVNPLPLTGEGSGGGEAGGSVPPILTFPIGGKGLIAGQTGIGEESPVHGASLKPETGGSSD